MDAKKFLYSVRDEQAELEELKERIEELTASCLPSGIRYDKDRVQTSPADTLTDKMARIGDYYAELDDKYKRLLNRRYLALQLINALQDSRQRQVLRLYFLSASRTTMEEVANTMGYSRSRTFDIYSEAIRNVRKIGLNRTKSD